jgi:cardiolipin synthase
MDLIWIIVAVIFAVYVVGVTLYIILENRSAQSTFAWLFLFILAPLIGLLVYYFFGKGWRVFAKENELVKEEMGHDLLADLKPLLACQEEYVARIAREEPGAYDKKMLQLSERNSSSLLTAYNQVDILQDASAKYPRLLVDLQQAKHHIHLNYYIWTEDEFTEQVKAVLIERAQAGVEVRCLYDASGGSMSRAYRQALIEAGVKIHAYLEFLSLSRIHTANHRSHRKLAVIDGRIGYMGGLNLDKDQLDGGPHFDSWRDTHLRMVGEAA